MIIISIIIIIMIVIIIIIVQTLKRQRWPSRGRMKRGA